MKKRTRNTKARGRAISAGAVRPGSSAAPGAPTAPPAPAPKDPPKGGTPATCPLHPAEQYAADVRDGKIVVGKWIRLAVERYYRDLETAADRGLAFRRDRAERAIRFFKFLRHSKGEWAKQVVRLEAWQQFIQWQAYGWYRTNSEGKLVRRFRMVYLKIGRKNGKSTFAAGEGLYLFFADGEPGAEVYTAATKREQARIVHGEAIAMVIASPELSRYITVFKDNLHIVETRSKFEPLGADENTSDGLNVHGAIVDELHAHKNRGLLDVLDSGTGSRRQPMIWMITTAGLDNLGVDLDMQQYAEKILQGIVEDDTFLAMIYAIDEKDDWRDETCWIKANPNLGVSVKIDDLRAKCRKAIEMPSAQNEFLCKHLNRSIKQISTWMPMEKWNACAEPIGREMLAGRRCYIGLDLSSKLDVAAAAALFPPTELDKKWRARVRFYVPEATAEKREREARVPYATWAKQGFLKTTEGNVIDYEFIKHDIFEDARDFEVVELAYDPWNATQIALQLQDDGINVVEVHQGFRSLSEPSKELEKLIASGMLAHDGNPVLDWMASNVAIETDPAGNIKPSKKGSAEKIDGIAALINALARAMLDGGGTAYGDDKELLVL